MPSSPFPESRYELVETLYDSSRTTVVRVRDRQCDDETVVLKCLTDPQPPAGQIHAFRREFEIGSALEGDEFVEYRRFERHGRSALLVLEDVDAEPLAALLQRRRVDVDEFLSMAIDIAAAVGRLHDQEVIHRDLNTSNLVWNPRTGRVKLTDFGLATRSDQLRLEGRSTETMGTLAYISPEQTGRTSRPVDYRTDYYSLGVTFYEMLTGVRPFESDDPGELVHAHLARRPESAHHRRRDVPRQLSRIIGKLMAKEPEQRYQSSYGLIADLERCLHQYRANEEITRFELGEEDRRTTLQISRRVYGRQEELRRLEDSIHQAGAGQRCITIVAGPAGVGKTMLTDEMQRFAVARRSRFVTGKFEQPRSARPYAAIAEAFGTAITQLLSRRPETVDRWRRRVRNTLGEDEALLARLLPQLPRLIGEPPRGPQLDPAEAKHRYFAAFHRFAALLARHSEPLVVVLEDLQWADDASLQLLEELLGDAQFEGVMVVGTVRSGQLDDSHPLHGVIRRLEEAGEQIETIELQPLGEDSIQRLVADSLDTTCERVAQLAELLYRKTSGNPYFAGQFLKNLDRDELLWFDAETGRWRWDSAAIAGQPVTDNVVDVLQRRIGELPEPTRRLLVDASFLGTRFDLDILAEVADTGRAEAYERLGPAVEADIVVGRGQLVLLNEQNNGPSAVVRHLAFSHDRVREAVMNFVAAERRDDIRLRIGRHLKRRVGRNGSKQVLFAAARNLNAVRELIESFQERIELVRLSLRAGEAALELQAISDAAEFLHVASDELNDRIWQHHPRLARRVLLKSGETALLEGRFEAVERRVTTACNRLTDPMELVEFHSLSIRQLTLESKLDAAIQRGSEVLQQLGVELPLSDRQQALQRQLQRVGERFGDRPVDCITEVPSDGDERTEAALKILALLQPPAGMLDFRLLLLVGLMAVELTFDVGVNPESVVGLAMYGSALCLWGMSERGGEAGRLALQLARDFDRLSLLSHTAFLFATMVLPWSRPLEESLPILQEGIDAGKRSGNYRFAGYNCSLEILHRFYLGKNLETLRARTVRALDFARRIHNTAAVDICLSALLICENLLGNTDGPGSFEADEVESAAEFIERCRKHDTVAAATVFEIARAQIELIDGCANEAVERLESLEDKLDSLVGTFDTARHPFWLAMALAHQLEESPPADPDAVRAKIEALRRQIGQRAEIAPENFGARLALVDAEIARLDDDLDTALESYERAVELARRRDMVHLEAFASQRVGELWLNRDRRRIAVLHLRDAADAWKLWGAHRKHRAFRRQHGELLAHTRNEFATGTTSSTGSEVIDVESVLRASEMIAGTLDLEKLLPVLMEVTLENAGAERGAFVVVEDNRLAVAVDARSEESPCRCDPPVQLEDWTGGAPSIVRYVHRTRESVVLGRTWRDPRFRADDYLQKQRIRSICCIPAEEHGKLRGILYLENNLVDEAFDEERIRVLEILGGHIAVALNKARLYAQLHEEKERFRQLAENIQEVFWLMDWPSRRIVYLSPAFEAVWGRPVPSLPMSTDDLLDTVVSSDRERIEEAFDQDLPTGDYDETYRIERPSGTRRWIHSKGFPITDANGEVRRIAGVARDITREHEISQMKDEFISIVSHELRTPLTPITGIFSMLQREHADELPENIQTMVELGLRNSRQLMRLIDDLLDIQRLSMEKLEFQWEIFDIREVVEETFETSTVRGEAQQIDHRLQMPDQPLKIRGDRSRLAQVVNNLLSNAVKFSDSGDTVEVRVEPTDGTARISVSDQGPGIPGHLHEQIFDKFTQADTTLTRTHGGVGLGLAITRALVDRFGGRIWFDTEIGEGTTFHVELPLTSAEKHRRERPPNR